MARAGMAQLIERMRQMAEAGTADYAVAGRTYWNDDDLQAAMDRYRRRVTGAALTPIPEYISGANVYLRYEMPALGAVEGTAGGTAAFRVHDSSGVNVDYADFAFNDDDLALTFDADRGGTAYYWSGYTYDLAAAARDIWQIKAGHAWTAINFSADGHRFDREALHKHCLEMAKQYGMQAGGSAAGGSGMRAGRLVRSDLAGSGDGDRF